MNEDQALKIVGIIAGAVPAVAEILGVAAQYFRSQGDLAKAQRIEDILPAKSESRAVQEQLEAKAP